MLRLEKRDVSNCLIWSVYDTNQMQPQFAKWLRYPTVSLTGKQQGCQDIFFSKSFRKHFCRSNPPVLVASSTMQHSSSNSFLLQSSLCVFWCCWVRYYLSFSPSLTQQASEFR
ncbi:hypothetical protein CHARACLAT_005495 [Characodon lateralis]|uniref:Uncharacterized protein n=1 Tax=Characodon lateralis TaxID=208331 RepID=A0ABU7CKN9_9TELE|nr:hypothetical protein [Characodon lateralis]